MEKAKKNQLSHFDIDMDKFSETASYVEMIIKVRMALSEQAIISTLTELHRETSQMITLLYPRMVGGSTSTLVVVHGYNSFSSLGRVQ